MKKTLTLFCLMALGYAGMAQNILNMELLANVNYPENCNDIWGYVDSDDGHEYAILGTTQATAVHDLADPSNPVELAYIPGSNSTWRDMKQWGEYAYVTTDVGTDGLLIINMSEAPDTITWEFWKPALEIGDFLPTTLQTCHNIYIDEKGYAYLSGCNIGNAGVIILDVHTTPGQPIYIGAADARYSHDSYVRGDTLWSSDINDGFFSVWDLSDRSNPEELVNQATTTFFTHNAWLSTDGKYLFTTDEKPNAYVDAYDISDLSDIKLLDSYQPADTRGQGVIPHNAHYLDGGYLVVSWYTDGVKIIDVNRPDNMVEVGSYDTFIGDFYDAFSGCWGVTPFLPSGLVIASDINTGLYVFDPTYVRACYLEGTVRSASTGMMLNNVVVEIEGLSNEATDFLGVFKTGRAEAGTVNVTFSKAGYETQTTSAELVNGEVTLLDIELQPLPSASITLQTLRDADDMPIGGASVFLVNETFTYELTTNADGTFTIPEVFFDDYEVYAGAWGYHNILFDDNLTINEDGTYVIRLEEGYQDDFILDLGWQVNGEASTGNWERGLPIGTNFQGGLCNPGADISGDVGNQCYVTGNRGGSAGDDDIDDGNTILTSPVMDLTTYNSPEIQYNLWFFNDGGGGAPNDILEVKITNGTEELILETLTSNESAGEWRTTSVHAIADMITLTDNMRLVVTSGDQDPGHLVEAAIDAFLVVEGEPNSTNSVEGLAFGMSAYPNPFTNQINVSYDLDTQTQGVLNVYNVLGQRTQRIALADKVGQVQFGEDLIKGIYFVEIQTANNASQTIRVVKE